MKLLLTGFPPYDDFDTNASQALAESLRADPPDRLRALRCDLAIDVIAFENGNDETQQRTMLACLHRLLDRHAPTVCIFCGQAPGRSRIGIEKIAVNAFKGRVIDPGGPPAYWATLPGLDDLPGMLRTAGIPAALSFHAGTHLCNHALYSALHRAAATGAPMRCGFVHVPRHEGQAVRDDTDKPFMPLAMAREALALIIATVDTRLSPPRERPAP